MRAPIQDPQHPAALKAAQLLRSEYVGTLCTASKRYEGWPFASLCPYALDPRGIPAIYIADIAQHTFNIDQDSRVSLMAREDLAATPGKRIDPQAHGRITWMGRATKIALDSADKDVINARYLAKVPDASRYRRMHGFAYYRLEPEVIRFIGGFGEIYWIEPGALAIDPEQDPLKAAAAGIIAHMNDDHVDSMELMAKAYYGAELSGVQMLHIDQFGYDVQGLVAATDKNEAPKPLRLRFEFSAPATPDNVRQRVVELVHQARAQLSE